MPDHPVCRRIAPTRTPTGNSPGIRPATARKAVDSLTLTLIPWKDGATGGIPEKVALTGCPPALLARRGREATVRRATAGGIADRELLPRRRCPQSNVYRRDGKTRPAWTRPKGPPGLLFTVDDPRGRFHRPRACATSCQTGCLKKSALPTLLRRGQGAEEKPVRELIRDVLSCDGDSSAGNFPPPPGGNRQAGSPRQQQGERPRLRNRRTYRRTHGSHAAHRSGSTATAQLASPLSPHPRQQRVQHALGVGDAADAFLSSSNRHRRRLSPPESSKAPNTTSPPLSMSRVPLGLLGRDSGVEKSSVPLRTVVPPL